jgi:hypothetical protein
MSRIRFTLAQLIALVLVIGVGFAALRHANALWASATFSLAIISVSVALAGAFARTGKGAISWAGFAITGAARLMSWLLSSATVGSWNGPPWPLLYHFQSYVNPAAATGWSYSYFIQVCNSLDVILLGIAGAVVCHFIAMKDDRSN